LKYQNFATGSGHILIPFIIGIGAGWGTDTRILLQIFYVTVSFISDERQNKNHFE